MKKNITKALSVLLGTAVITGGIGAAAYAANSGEPTGAVKVGRVLSASKDSDGEVKKDETVYVIASSDGTVKKIIVSDWIKNSAGMTEISDRSDLDNIENVKGDEKYTPGGDNVKVWDAEGNDIYYQGSIEKELPVMISVSYMLDGKSISASDLPGKSGKVTIRFDYKNNQTVNVKVGDREEKMYVPFAVLTGMLLDNDVFTNITVENGRLINDGDRTAVVGMAFPGLQENLAIDKDRLEIPDHVIITADVKNFGMTNTVTVAVNDVFAKIDTGKADVSGLEGSLSELSGAMTKLTDGSSELYNGLCTLLDKSGELISGINRLAGGALTLKNGAASLDKGVCELKAGIGELKDGLTELDSHSKELNDGAGKVFETLLATVDKQLADSGLTVDSLTTEGYKKTLTDLLADPDDTQKKELIGIADAALNEQLRAYNVPEEYYPAVKYMLCERLSEGMTTEKAMTGIVTVLTHAKMYAADPKTYAAFAPDALALQNAAKTAASAQGQAAINGLCLSLAKSRLRPQIEAAVAQLDEYNKFCTGLTDYTNGVSDALDGSGKLNAGAADLKKGSAKLNAGAKELYNGILTLKNGAPALTDGITKLRDGSLALSDGIKEFNEKGVQKFIDAVDGDIAGLVDRINATVEAAGSCNNFSGIADGTDGEVKFIYRTDSVESGNK